MYCLFLLCASLYISLPHTCQAEDDPMPFEKIVQDYFRSESVQELEREWEAVRKGFEQALITFMNDNIGSPGVNVYVRQGTDKKLADGYFHNDNQVRVIFKDLNLEAMPYCLFPELKFTLASNILKVYSTLSKMIIHADYVLIRNKSDIIHNPAHQDPYKSSPFLFEQVQDVGKVAISMDSCELKGFYSLEMDVGVIDLGHDRFNLFNCVYTIEIYRPGDESPPVIALYNMSDIRNGFDLTDLLKKPLITNSLYPTIQSAIYTFVNTTAVFGNEKIQNYRDNEGIVMLLTRNEIAEVVRKMNKLTVEKNHGAIEMADYEVHWDDGRVFSTCSKGVDASCFPHHRPNFHGIMVIPSGLFPLMRAKSLGSKTAVKVKPSKKNEAGTGESLKLTEMVLTGLDTLYSAHKGGPFELDTVRLVEKLRFSSLQVRGKLEIISTWSDIFHFASEISDLAVDLHIELSENINSSKPGPWIKDRKLEVEAMRKMTFTVPTLIFGSAESLIGGYLLKEVPQLINAHTMAMFDQGMQEGHSSTKLGDAGENKNEFDDLVLETDYDYQGKDKASAIVLDDSKPPMKNGARERDMLKKNKKRFRGPNHPRRRRGRRGRTFGKRVANNEIRNK